MQFIRRTLRVVVVCAFAASIAAQAPLPPAASSPAGEPASADEQRIQKEVERQLAERDKKAWKLGVRPNGGGFFLSSPDEKIQFRLLGYAQALATIVGEDFTNSFGSTDLRIRRARVGWLMTFDKTWELFIEYDGVPQTGNLVEARLNWLLRGDDIQLRVGKFVVPLTEEGWRSSRNYDTIERFAALNAMYGLPALDTQFGAMIWGQVLKDNRLTYYAGIWNGNASASDNARDNNDDKELQVKFTYKLTPELRAGIGFDHTVEERQTLRLNSLTGTRFAAIDVNGPRRGVDGDIYYEKGRRSLRAEVLHAGFTQRDATLTGAFLQGGYFLSGDANGGFQPLVRLERSWIHDNHARGDARTSAITALTAGFQWFLTNNVRFQFNAVAEHFNRDAGQAVAGDGVKPSLLTELQYRF